MLLMAVHALGHYASSGMFALLATQHSMVGQTVHINFRIFPQDSQISQCKRIAPFEVEVFEEAISCQEVTVDLTANNKSGDLYRLACTPVDLNALEHELSYYPKLKASFLLDGFMNGFRLNYVGPRMPTQSKNLKSATSRPEITQQKINKEVAEGRVAGPFSYPPLATLRISPLGLVEKKQPGEFRLIHHLSHPPNDSVNDYIDPKLCFVKYASFDEAVEIVQELGQGCLLAKSDIKNAFRLIPIAAQDFDQLGFYFNNKYYFDKSLPFGCSISCSTFDKFSTFLEFAVRRRSAVGKLLHYLDDFLFGGPKGTNDCKIIMGHFEICMAELGVPIAREKTVGPTTVICFLGLELDTLKMEVRIPIGKVHEIVQKIQVILQKEKVTLKAMQSLIGVLQFACRAIRPGRPFCRRLINSTCGLSNPYHHIRVTKNIKNDLKMWLSFFQTFNGISMFHDRFWVSSADVDLYSDSAGSIGFGIYFAGRWACATWPIEWVQSGLTKDITVLELFPILVSLYLWGNELRNKKILYNCDNAAVVYAINTMTSKSEKVMTLLRALTLKCLRLNVVAKAKHIAGKTNITDSLSRLQLDKFRELAPLAQKDPDVMPNHLWEIFSRDPENY